MPFSTDALNYMLDQFGTNEALFRSLHTAYSAVGANELSGGSPAYARKAAVWDAAASGAKAMSGANVFDVPAGSNVKFIGLWDASTGGTFHGMMPNGGGPVKVFTAAATGDVITCYTHGYSDGQTVVVWPGVGATLPTGLTAGTMYFVRDATTDTIKLAATSGGAAIDLTANGAGLIQAITALDFSIQGTFTLSDPSVGSMLTLV
jgi:hypothetical protein